MENRNAFIEAACASLVREYLSRKGLKGTLCKMDEELPRNELSISNRQALMKHVHIENLMRRNKKEQEPMRAMLELMTKYFMEEMPHLSFGKLSDDNLSQLSDNGGKSANNNWLEMNGHHDKSLMKSVPRPSTVTVTSKREREKASNYLIVDEDVKGETIIGGGLSGIIDLEITESFPQNMTKAQLSRPVSSKQNGGAIFSNDDALATRRRNQHIKTTKALLSQPEQQQRKSKDLIDDSDNCDSAQTLSSIRFMQSDTTRLSNNISHMESLATTSSPTSNSSVIKTSPLADIPVSFEALLLKGEERSTMLQRKNQNVENKIPSTKYKVENSSMGQKLKSGDNRNERDNHLQNFHTKSDLVFAEVEDIGSSIADIAFKPTSSSVQKPVMMGKFQSTPIDLKTAITLKNIVLGSPNQIYSDEWLLQGFSFCDAPNIKYGLVQKKGGPCGVLAAVQACLLQELLFGNNKLPETKCKNPSKTERSKALASALSNILWRAGDQLQAVVTLPSQATHILGSTKFKQDGLTETINIYKFTNFDDLSSFLTQSVSELECDERPGVLLTVYSAILSRKPHQVRADFDVPEQTSLISCHGYCIQELVNLLLTGRAVSNVFNDVIQLESGGLGQCVTLKGIHSRSDIGFLSLFEHYKSCQVGTYYKTPKNPIWVICSESHFSVMFSTRKDLINDWKAERIFDLIYYDGLAKQEEEIKLTVSTLNQSYKPAITDDDLIPPLEHCIRTKWADAEINWNGTEPIL